MWFLAIVVAGLLGATFRLTTRYQYGPKSQRLLLADLAGSIVVGLVLARYFFLAEATGVFLILGGLGIGVLVFVLAALVTVEVLRKARQHEFDTRLADLRGREQRVLAQLDGLNRDMRSELRRREEADQAGHARRQRLESHRDRVERWKHEGGAARIRSIKVEEWEQEFRALGAEARLERRAALEEELVAATDPERRSHLEAMLAVAALTDEGETSAAAPSDERGSDQGISAAADRRREAETELAATRTEMREWQQKLREFLAREIKLE